MTEITYRCDETITISLTGMSWDRAVEYLSSLNANIITGQLTEEEWKYFFEELPFFNPTPYHVKDKNLATDSQYSEDKRLYLNASPVMVGVNMRLLIERYGDYFHRRPYPERKS